MPDTIEDFLYSVDPDICFRRTSKDASHSHVAGPICPTIIRKWKDFDVPTLKQMGDGIFRRALEAPFNFHNCPLHVGHKRQEFEMPDDEGVLDSFLIISIQQTVSCALLQTQTRLHRKKQLTHIPMPGIKMVRGTQAAKLKSKCGRHTYLPDWTACLPKKPTKEYYTYQPEKTPAILVGDTKLRWKVDFNQLNDALEFKTKIDFKKFGLERRREAKDIIPTQDKHYLPEYHGLRQAIIQLYTYCYNAECRYGYLITETQLFVMRIRPGDASQRAHGDRATMMEAVATNGLLEYRTIGYNVKDRNKLSVNLALWWLHLLAAVDQKIRWQYPPMGEMTFDPRTAGKFYRKRCVSEESESKYSRVSEDQYYDCRPPYGRKPMRQSTLHSGTKNQDGESSGVSDLDSDEQVHDEPESDPISLPDSNEQIDGASRDIAKFIGSRTALGPRTVLGSKSSNKKVTQQAKPVQRPHPAKKPKPIVKLPPRKLPRARPPLAYLPPGDRPKAKRLNKKA